MNDILHFQIYGNSLTDGNGDNDEDNEDVRTNITRFVSSGSSSQCSICLNTIQTGAECGMLTCGHSYHYNCIERWLNVNTSCPTCRRSTRNNSDVRETQTQTRRTTRPRYTVSQVISHFDQINLRIHFINNVEDNTSLETVWNIHEPVLNILEFISKFCKMEQNFYIKLGEHVFKYTESTEHLSKEIINFVSFYDTQVYVFAI